MTESKRLLTAGERFRRFLLHHYFRLMIANGMFVVSFFVAFGHAASKDLGEAMSAAAVGFGFCVFSMIFLIVLESDEARRQAWLQRGYIREVRNYAVDNIEPLRESLDALHDVVAPKPPAEVPTTRLQIEDRPLSKRERDTLLTIVAVLCKEANIDYARPAKAAATIKTLMIAEGLSVGESTIEEHLKRIQDALEAKSR